MSSRPRKGLRMKDPEKPGEYLYMWASGPKPEDRVTVSFGVMKEELWWPHDADIEAVKKTFEAFLGPGVQEFEEELAN